MAMKYRWLAERLELLIQENIRAGIHKLPTEAELAVRYHVSRQTVRAALTLLEQKRLIEKKQGSGSYITGLSADPSRNNIAVLVSSDQEYIYPRVLNDIRDTLFSHGFFPQVLITDNQIGQERELLLHLLKKPPRGMIVEGCKSALPNPNLDLYRKLIHKNCPIVFLFNYYPQLPECPFIKDDNFGGSALLVRHLEAQGHRMIGALIKADDLQGIERYQGYIETMRDLGLPIPDRQIFWYSSRELDNLTHKKQSGFLRETAAELQASCTAVICYNDLIAYYLIDELLLAGSRLPEDLAIAAFDNTWLSRSRLLTVTTLSHEPHEMGQKAAEAIIKKLSGLPVASQEIRWKLNAHKSTLGQS